MKQLKYPTLLVLGLLLFGMMPSVFANDGEVQLEVQAGITPDSPLYGIERALEIIRMRLTFGDETKVNYGLLIAEERLSEIQAMIKKNNSNAIEKAQQERVKIVNEIQENSLRLKEEVRQRVALRLQVHIGYMQNILKNAPEQAKSGIGTAISNSQNLMEKIEESLVNSQMSKGYNVQS